MLFLQEHSSSDISPAESKHSTSSIYGVLAVAHTFTYPLDARRLKSAKFHVRAVKGYFVGHQKGGSTNFRIWLPEVNVIKESPHVTFIETQPYKSNFKENRLMAEVAPCLLEDNQEIGEQTTIRSIDLPEISQNHSQSGSRQTDMRC